MTQNQFSTNVLILGKTGVGKSALLNYLIGDEIAEAGSGKPVTGQGIYTYSPFTYKGIDIVVNDSWGIEPDKAGKWKEIIEGKVKENNSKEIKDWFHTIIYCIDAKRSRIEQFEREEIIDPLIRDGNYIVICFTKSDLASEKEKEENKKIINQYYKYVDFAEVSSVGVKLRGGKTTSQFGREEILKIIVTNLRRNLVFKLSNNMYTDIKTILAEQYKNAIAFYKKESGPLGIFTIYGEDFQNSLRDKSKKLYFEAFSKRIRKFNNDITIIDNLTKNICDKFLQGIECSNIVRHFDLTTFKDWDNDAKDYVRSIVASVFRVYKFRSTEYEEKYDAFLKEIHVKILNDTRDMLNTLLKSENINYIIGSDL